jgi:prepilin-type N-terminal cleavage/methylation domain-containing protein
MGHVLVNQLTYFRRSGFTIVELLIVIVIISVLAAISIVAYNGIQNRGKTTSAQSSATAIIKKVELYNTHNGHYPVTFAALTAAATTDPWHVTGISRSSIALSDTSPTSNVSYWICGQSSTSSQLANASSVTAANIRGIRVFYRDYGTSSNNSIATGIVTTPSGQNPVDCFNSQS